MLKIQISAKQQFSKKKICGTGALALNILTENLSNAEEVKLHLYPLGFCKVIFQFKGIKEKVSDDFIPPPLLIPYFGQSIRSICCREGSALPGIIFACISQIEKRRYGLKEEGLYRVSGSQSAYQELKLCYDTGSPVDFEDACVHDLTGLLKMYLRELPEPLITHALHSSFMGAVTDKPDVESFKKLLMKLPDVNRNSLIYIFDHLHSVLSYSKDNKMTIFNLSVCIAPSLMKYRGSRADASMGLQSENSVVQLLLAWWPIEGFEMTPRVRHTKSVKYPLELSAPCMPLVKSKSSPSELAYGKYKVTPKVLVAQASDAALRFLNKFSPAFKLKSQNKKKEASGSYSPTSTNKERNETTLYNTDLIDNV